MSCIISQKYQMMANHMLQKIKDTYVSQCVDIVRDNVHIGYREWKGKADNIIHTWFQT
jgi:hypothetical protein